MELAPAAPAAPVDVLARIGANVETVVHGKRAPVELVLAALAA
jgi:hypothetical protein